VVNTALFRSDPSIVVLKLKFVLFQGAARVVEVTLFSCGTQIWNIQNGSWAVQL